MLNLFRRRRPDEASSLPKTSLLIPVPPGAQLTPSVEPLPSPFDPIFSAWQRAGLVEVAPTAVGLLSVSVEDHSSVQRPPTRLWSFLDRSQAEGLHRALGEWLATSEGQGGSES